MIQNPDLGKDTPTYSRIDHAGFGHGTSVVMTTSNGTRCEIHNSLNKNYKACFSFSIEENVGSIQYLPAPKITRQEFDAFKQELLDYINSV